MNAYLKYNIFYSLLAGKFIYQRGTKLYYFLYQQMIEINMKY